jgi:ferric-dicitrate binding protein FerR (iron transport regulator)
MNKHIHNIIGLFAKSGVENPIKGQFHEWLIDNKSAEEKEDALFSLWNSTEGTSTEHDSLAALERLKIKAQTENQFSTAEKKNPKLVIWKYTAAIIIALCITSAYILTQKNTSEINFAEHYSPAGHSEKITLPDGSVVLTNSGSIILYPKSFGKDTRTLYMSGEANFKVQKNGKIPFIVKSREFTVTALGTEFDVSSYPEDNYYRATLINGVVKVKHDNDAADHILRAGDQFSFDKKTGKHTVYQTDISEAIAWQRGELIFRGVTIKDIIKVLERKYAVTFQYKPNTIDNDKYNFRFNRDASLTEILDIIKTVSGGFRYKKIDNIYYLTSKG